MRIRHALATATLGTTFVLGALAAPVQASEAAPSGAASLSCRLAWSDSYTAGVSCTGGTFVAWANCKNGSRAQGAAAASGGTSYAYCSSYGSSLVQPVRWGAVEVR